MTLSRRACLALALPAFAQSPPARFRLASSGTRFWLISPNGRPFFPLFGANAALKPGGGGEPYLQIVDASAWPSRNLEPAAPADACFGLGWSVKPDAMANLRALGSDHELKSRWVDFLKERYEYNIAQVNQTYAIESTSFSDLLVDNFKSLDQSRPAVRRDDSDFLEALRSQIEKDWSARYSLPVFRLGESGARPEIWLDRFTADPPPHVVGMRAPGSGADAWLLSREKLMADWRPDPQRR